MSCKLLTIQGIYDGKNIVPLKNIKVKDQYRIIINFLDKIEPTEGIENLRLHSEKVFEKLWENENDEIWNSYL